MSQIQLFNTWSSEGITIQDEGLKAYITISDIVVPKTGARYAGNRFHKSKIHIVERLVNKLMIAGHRSKKHTISSGHQTGKAQQVLRIVHEAFKRIESKTNQNPLAVFVKALEHAAPREEIVTIEYGGARYPKAVDCAPQRRIDVALRYMVQGAYNKSFNSAKAIEDALADEIMAAWNMSNTSNAIAKKIDVERQSDSSR